MTQVLLRIYEFQLYGELREYHAEIVVYGYSHSYSDEGLEESIVQNKDGLEGYTLVSTYNLGHTKLFEYEFEEFYVPEIIRKFAADAYDLYDFNCRVFALYLIHVLRPTRADIGIQILEDLNNMSAQLGNIVHNVYNTVNYFENMQVRVLLISAVILLPLITICHYLIPSEIKEYVMFIMICIIMIQWLNRHRL